MLDDVVSEELELDTLERLLLRLRRPSRLSERLDDLCGVRRRL